MSVSCAGVAEIENAQSVNRRCHGCHGSKLIGRILKRVVSSSVSETDGIWRDGLWPPAASYAAIREIRVIRVIRG